MVVDLVRAWRESAFGSSPRRRRHSCIARPAVAAEPLEDRSLLSAVTFLRTFEGVDWVSAGAGGVGSQWNGGGSATLTVGVEGEVVAAYLYWRGVDLLGRGGDGVYDNASAVMNGVGVTGVSLGTGGTGTWGPGGSQAFRADVTGLVRAGVTSYAVASLASKVGHSADGVSLVVVYQDGNRANDRDLYVLDGNAVNVTANVDDPWDVRLDGLVHRTGGVRAELHMADGQSVGEAGLRFTGAGSAVDVPDRIGRFDGSSVPDLGKSRAINGSLWDVHGFDVTAAVGGAGTHSLALAQGTGSSDSLALIVMLVDTAAAPANTPPVAYDVSLSVMEDGSVGGVLDARDAQGAATLTYSIAAGPEKGAVVLDAATGGFVFTPPKDFFGTVSFVYAATDGEFTALATVTVVVTAVNDAPVALPQSFSTREDERLVGRVSASDVDGEVLSFLLLEGPASGSLSLAADGTFVFTPARDWSGESSFRVAVTDGAATAAVVVSLRVDAVNDPPVAASAEWRVARNAAAGQVVGSVAATDVDGGVLAYAIRSGNGGGGFAIDAKTGAIRVADRRALLVGAEPVFVLTVEVTDGRGGVGTAVVTVRVVAPAVRFEVGLPGSRGVVDLKGLRWQPVVIYSTAEFDARQVEVGSLTFGRTGDERSVVRVGGRPVSFAFIDVNGDGRRDLVVLVDVRATGLRVGDVGVTLKGRLKDGTALGGTAPVTVQSGKPAKKVGK